MDPSCGGTFPRLPCARLSAPRLGVVPVWAGIGVTAYDGFLFQFKTGAAGYLWSERDGLVDPNVVLAPGFSDTILAANALNVHAPIAATRDDGGVNTQTVLLTPTGSIHWMGTGGGDFTDASKRDDSLGFSPSTKFLDHVLAPTDTSTVRVTANIETKSVQVGGGGGLLSLELANGATVRTTSGLGIASSGLLTGNGTIVGGVVNRGALEVSDVTISDGLENEATAKPVGSGKLTAALANKGSGHVEIDQGSQLRIDGSGHTNEGVMVVLEGEL